MRFSSTIALSISVFVLSLSFAADLAAEGFLGGRLTVSGGYAVKVLDGAKDYSDRPSFDITAPHAAGINVTETPTRVTASLVPGDEYGYGLSSRVFDGFGFCLDYRLGKRWSLFLGYDMFLTKSGNTTLYWEADPSGVHAGLTGSYEYDAHFRVQQMTLGVRFFVLPQRWYLMLLSQPTLAKISESGVWRRSLDGVEWISGQWSDESLNWYGGHAAGTGYQYALSERMVLAVEADYRFRVEELYNGLSVRTHVRYRL